MKHLELNKIVLIGASTGGPSHIQKILKALPEDFNASIVIAQHMGNEFIPSFTKQLNTITKIEVQEAQSDLLVENSTCYICSLSTKIVFKEGRFVFEKEFSKDAYYNPDINTLFTSAARLESDLQIMGIILTGIGDDGVLGCEELSKNSICIAADEKSSIVYGMPAQAALRVKNIKVESLDNIIEDVLRFGE